MVCKFCENVGKNSCSIIDWDTGETLALGEDYALELALNRMQLANNPEFEFHRRRRGLKECTKLSQDICKIKRIDKKQRLSGEELLEIDFPNKLSCKKTELNISCFSNDKIDPAFGGFEGIECWDILEERFAELEKKEAELK